MHKEGHFHVLSVSHHFGIFHAHQTKPALTPATTSRDSTIMWKKIQIHFKRWEFTLLLAAATKKAAHKMTALLLQYDAMNSLTKSVQEHEVHTSTFVDTMHCGNRCMQSFHEPITQKWRITTRDVLQIAVTNVSLSHHSGPCRERATFIQH